MRVPPLVRQFAIGLWLLPEVLLVAIAAALPLLLGLGVLARYSELFVVVWVDELVRLLFLWLSFLGAATAVKRQAHFRMTIVVERTPLPYRTILEGMAHATLIVLGLLFVILGDQILSLSEGQTTSILRIPVSFVYSIIPATGGLFVLYSVINIVRLLRGKLPDVPEEAAYEYGEGRSSQDHSGGSR